MDILKIAESIPTNQYISKEDILEIAHAQNVDIKDSSVFWLIRQLIESGVIARNGRNSYYRMTGDKTRIEYCYQPSEKLANIIGFLKEEYPLLDFQAWESVQFNYFINHQIAHNTIFVEVENMLQDSVYETLRDEHGRNVLLKPTVDIYNLYAEDDTIVILNLVSETPVTTTLPHSVLLEKLLVDMMSNKIIPMFVQKSEFSDVYEEAFSKYHIDESRLFRYARRRNAEDRLRKFLKEETNIKLVTEDRNA